MTAYIRKHARIWLRTASMSLQGQLNYRYSSVGYFIGKMIRLLFFFGFLAAIFDHVETIAGYNFPETALFFLTFNIIDISAQVLFLGVYDARRIVNEGDFDFYLVQPCSPLFRMVCTSVDFLDMAALAPVLIMCVMVILQLPVISWHRLLAYGTLLLNGIALVFSIHVFVGALAVRTQQMENAIWIYRDLMFLGKFPIEVYSPILRWVLTIGIPIAVMTSFPAKALLGILSWKWIAYAFILTSGFVAASVVFWQESITHYTSSSS